MSKTYSVSRPDFIAEEQWQDLLKEYPPNPMKLRKNFKDLTGMKVDRLIVLYPVYSTNSYKKWLCLCECGEYVIRTENSIRNKKGLNRKSALSCGCTNNFITHGAKRRNKEIYKRYIDMMARCYRSNTDYYHDYGGRGISVCEEWRNDPNVFIDWAESNGFKDELILDRIDVNGNYHPDNCRWITKADSANNKRTQKNSTTGFKGMNKHSEGFTCDIRSYGSVTYFGFFKPENLKIAVAIRDLYIHYKGWDKCTYNFGIEKSKHILLNTEEFLSVNNRSKAKDWFLKMKEYAKDI